MPDHSHAATIPTGPTLRLVSLEHDLPDFGPVRPHVDEVLGRLRQQPLDVYVRDARGAWFDRHWSRVEPYDLGQLLQRALAAGRDGVAEVDVQQLAGARVGLVSARTHIVRRLP